MATAPLIFRPLTVTMFVFLFFFSISISISHAHRLSELPETAASFQIEKLLDDAATITTTRNQQSQVNELLQESETDPKILLPTEIPESEPSSSTTTAATNPLDLNIEAEVEKKQPESDVNSDKIEGAEKKLPESGTIPSKIDEKEATLATETVKLPTIGTTKPLTLVNLIPVNPHYPRDYQMRRSSRLPLFRIPRRCRHRHHHHQQLFKQWESQLSGFKQHEQQPQQEDVVPSTRVTFGDDLILYKNGGGIRRKEIPARWIGAGDIGGADIFHQVETKIPETEDGLAFDEFKRPSHFYHHHRHEYEHHHHHHHHHHDLDDFEDKEHEHKYGHEHEEGGKKHHEEKDDSMLIKIRKFLTRF